MFYFQAEGERSSGVCVCMYVALRASLEEGSKSRIPREVVCVPKQDEKVYIPSEGRD